MCAVETTSLPRGKSRGIRSARKADRDSYIVLLPRPFTRRTTEDNTGKPVPNSQIDTVGAAVKHTTYGHIDIDGRCKRNAVISILQAPKTCLPRLSRPPRVYLYASELPFSWVEKPEFATYRCMAPGAESLLDRDSGSPQRPGRARDTYTPADIPFFILFCNMLCIF